jgi:diaminobutyrate-2-oxoglutarate transaminase
MVTAVDTAAEWIESRRQDILMDTNTTHALDTFKNHESQARSYCRNFPVMFARAKGSVLYSDDGREYIDFLSGAGALNYGHNAEPIKRAVADYIADDNVLMTLDLHSIAKKRFIDTFVSTILQPRGLDYRLQFTSPTGTSVVESAVKLARKTTGRQNIVAFTNGYHGMSGVSLSLTGNRYHRQAVAYGPVTRLPYDGYMDGLDSVALLRKMIEDESSGLDIPAAVILESVQGEGGLNVASVPWLQALRELTAAHGILMIIDDIQAGCGRSGRFFSFERAGIVPDLVCLSKSIGGLGLPMALLLISPVLDIWRPGEDNGTFRGNNLAFVAGAAAISTYWGDPAFESKLAVKSAYLRDTLEAMVARHPDRLRKVRGTGMMQGIEFMSDADTDAVIQYAFANGLIVESCGPRGEVLKMMPALTIPMEVLEQGLGIVAQALDALFAPGAATAVDHPVHAVEVVSEVAA